MLIVNETVKKAKIAMEHYAHGISSWLGANVKDVQKSVPVQRWGRWYDQHLRNPRATYEQAIKRHEEMIAKYMERIRKNREKIDKLYEINKEYERRIKKHKRAIMWLKTRIKILEMESSTSGNLQARADNIKEIDNSGD